MRFDLLGLELADACDMPGCWPVRTFIHPSLFTVGSKAKVTDKVNMHEELSNQVVLVIYFLNELVDSKTEVYLTAWIRMSELCGAQLHEG
ncbi:unnamed protein product [Prunus armeniaca]